MIRKFRKAGEKEKRDREAVLLWARYGNFPKIGGLAKYISWNHNEMFINLEVNIPKGKYKKLHVDFNSNEKYTASPKKLSFIKGLEKLGIYYVRARDYEQAKELIEDYISEDEDSEDEKIALRALADIKSGKSKVYSWEEVKKEIDLED